MTDCAVAVVNWNGGSDLRDCLASVAAQTRAPGEIVLVDNGSTDGSADAAVARFPGLRRIDLPENPGFGAAANAALRATGGDPLIVLNPDVVLDTDWLAVVADAFETDPRLGAGGGKLLYPDGHTIQHAGGFLRRPLMLADHRRYQAADDQAETEPVDVEYVTGAALALRRSAVEAVGGFDPGFFLYFEETDLCQRLRDAGWRVRYLPRARAIHRESAVTKRESSAYYRMYHHGRIRYALKHLSPVAFLGELVPAERARLASVVSIDELAGLRHAFVDHAALLSQPDGDGLVPTAPELRPAIVDALAGLVERALATTPTSARVEAMPSTLSARATLEPPPFRSGVPLLGSAIAAFRSAWNSVSTRWYLAPILDQQSAFNREVAAALERIEARLSALERRSEIEATWLVELDHDLVALVRRLAAGESSCAEDRQRPEPRP